MSNITLSANAGGTGIFTIASPSSNTNRTLTLPDVTGTFNVSGAATEVPAGSASTPSIYPTGDTNTGMFFPAADTIAFTEGGTESARLDSSGNFQFNSGYGSVAVAYGCRAWVNFNGTGTVAIRASGNVSSITDNGTGDYTVNFTTALPDANYSLNMTIQRGDGAGVNPGYACVYGTAANAYTSLTSSSARIISANSATAALDMPYVGVSVFR
jgi:hypothetical protein